MDIFSPILNISFSFAAELERILSYVKKIAWYQERGYVILLPGGISAESSLSEISDAIRREYDEEAYRKHAEAIRLGSVLPMEQLSKGLMACDLLLLPAYHVHLTKYGTMGSYDLPDVMTINLAKPIDQVGYTLCHETLHLLIEDEIVKNGISHWNKERLVDLMGQKFFGENYHMQALEKADANVDELFNRRFPDVRGMMREIAAMQA